MLLIFFNSSKILQKSTKGNVSDINGHQNHTFRFEDIKNETRRVDFRCMGTNFITCMFVFSSWGAVEFEGGVGCVGVGGMATETWQ